MRPLIQEVTTGHTPESLVAALAAEPGVVLLRSAGFDLPQARYSLVAARPFLTFRSFGSRCEIEMTPAKSAEWSAEFIPVRVRGCELTRTEVRAPIQTQFGNPWHVLDALLARCELLDEIDLPFPLGGGFGYWGYGLKSFVEPKLARHAVDDLELPDCHVGFYGSLVVFDHRLGNTCVVATGLSADGSRSEERAREQAEFWRGLLSDDKTRTRTPALSLSERERENHLQSQCEPVTEDSSATFQPFAGCTSLSPVTGSH